jgi:hypothetical protein
VAERRVVRRIVVRTVSRVAFAASLCVWGIAFVGLVALYVLGLVSGGLGGVEGFIASLGFTGFRLSILPFLGVFIVVAVLASATAAVLAALLAHLYNSLYPLVGGVEFAMDEARPSTVRRVQPPPPPSATPAVAPHQTPTYPAPSSGREDDRSDVP